MIKTKTALKRDARDERIKTLYLLYKVEQNGMKSAVVEQIAREVKTSVSTVNRVVKHVTLTPTP